MSDVPHKKKGEETIKPMAAVKDTVRVGKRNFMLSTQRYIPIAEIREDTVLLKNGGLRAVMKVHALNFNLKSEVEQQSIITGYQAFVNTLLFPIQIVVRSTRLNIDPYLRTIQEKAKGLGSTLLKNQTNDYAAFMEKLVSVADIMQKHYYIIIPVDGTRSSQRGLLSRFYDWLNVDDTKAKALQRNRDFKNYSKIMRDRVTLVQSGLESIGITVERMKSPELAQLYYQIYNPETSQKEKFGSLGDLNIEKGMMI